MVTEEPLKDKSEFEKNMMRKTAHEFVQNLEIWFSYHYNMNILVKAIGVSTWLIYPLDDGENTRGYMTFEEEDFLNTKKADEKIEAFKKSDWWAN